MKTMDTVGLAVFGAGRIGALHAVNVARAVSGATLVGVADVDLQAAQRVIYTAGVGRASTRFEDFLNDPAVQAVLIATPTDTHAEIMRRAAEAGKHIFCEKPIALTLEATDMAIAAVQSCGVKLQVGFNRRYDPAWRHARAAIERGDIGQPWIVKMVGRDPRIAPMAYLASSGGQFKDQSIHEFDAARWLMGSDVESVFATGSVLIDPGVADLGDVDTSLTTLRFPGGALGLVDSCRQAVYGFDIRGEVHGAAGKLMIGYEGRTAVTLLQPNKVSHDHVDWFLEKFADAYRDEVIDFVRCVQMDETPGVTGHDGREALRIAVAAGRSLREQRLVPLAEVTAG